MEGCGELEIPSLAPEYLFHVEDGQIRVLFIDV